MNTIEFRLCNEDRARLDRIIAALEGLTPAPAPAEFQTRYMGKWNIPAEPAEEHPADAPTTHLEPTVAAPDAPVAEPAPVEPAPVEPAPTPEVKSISKSEFQKAIVSRCAESPVMKAKVQALVHRYATSVSAIPEDKRSEVLAELAAL